MKGLAVDDGVNSSLDERDNFVTPYFFALEGFFALGRHAQGRAVTMTQDDDWYSAAPLSELEAPPDEKEQEK